MLQKVTKVSNVTELHTKVTNLKKNVTKSSNKI